MLQRKDDSEFFMFCCIGKCPVCKKYFQVIVFCFLLYDMERNAIVKVKTDQLLGFEILCFAFAVIYSSVNFSFFIPMITEFRLL